MECNVARVGCWEGQEGGKVVEICVWRWQVRLRILLWKGSVDLVPERSF